tara:strand:- start:136 stop:306 length:171 start_codon:yes stop_codon:yes gene_type:complete
METKKLTFNEKQRLKYQNNLEFRKKKQELARQYYQNKKYGNFEITISNEIKKLSFQ